MDILQERKEFPQGNWGYLGEVLIMSDIKIISRKSQTLTVDTYVIKIDDHNDNILYKEHIDEDYTIVDAYIQTQDGHIIDDPALLEKIENKINKIQDISQK